MDAVQNTNTLKQRKTVNLSNSSKENKSDSDDLERAHSPLVEVKENGQDVNVLMELQKLASFNELNEQVQLIVANSSWYELYGREWRDMLLGIPILIIGIALMNFESFLCNTIGLFLLSIVNFMWSDKGGHLAVHGSLGRSRFFNKLCAEFFINFNGGFSAYMGYDIHIKTHHPHTNIIGLGDSSTWKAPFLGPYTYLYLGPLLLPILTPLLSVQLLLEKKLCGEISKFITIFLAGIGFYSWLLIHFANFSLISSIMTTLASRAILAAPYIHVNIFQHIGLPMYDPKSRPLRLYQMSTGVLNLARNPLFDRIFGHSLINCHIEHHLFPRLSDYMCLKIKPLVKDFLVRNNLPYHERPYMERLRAFTINYDKYMRNAPPITHFVGIQ